MLDLLSMESLAARHHSKSARQVAQMGAESLNRGRFYARLRERPPQGLHRNEIESHFRGMPAGYWERLTKTELMWALETIHAFFDKVRFSRRGKATVLAVSRPYPQRGLTKVMVCAWDRPGLLATIAAGFSALRLNILRADVYTRADGLALDVFEVCEAETADPSKLEKLDELMFLLEGALCSPPRFASMWAGEFHKLLPRPSTRSLRVAFDDEYSAEYTLIHVQTSDRLGLLYDLLHCLTECGLNVAQATVQTEDGTASDVFYVTDLKGAKISSSSQLEHIRKALIRAVT